jgi:hypothetical protein
VLFYKILCPVLSQGICIFVDHSCL